MELSVGRHEPGPRPDRERREPAGDELVGVLPERDLFRSDIQQRRKAGTKQSSPTKTATKRG